MKTNLRAAGLGLIVTLLITSCFNVCAFGQTTADVRSSLEQLHNWVGADENGLRWRAFLRSADLEKELAKGDEASSKIIQEILNLYSSATPGLDLSPFVNVRLSIENWLAQRPQSLGQLAESLTNSKAHFQPLPSETFSSRRAELQRAIDSLDAFLSTSGEENRTNWNTYLLTADLRQQLAVEKPDAGVLNTVLSQYRANETGLELEPFTQVRSALRSFILASQLFHDVKPQDTFTKNIDDLTKRLLTYDSQPNLDDAMFIGRSLGYLRGSSPNDPAVVAIGKRFSRPNLHARVSQRLMAAGIEENVNDVSPLRDNILGTEIIGTACTTGRVSLSLVPDPHRAILQLCMSGTTQSQNVGYNGPVTIYSRGESQVASTKRLVFTEAGFEAEPATASVSTSTTIDDIAARCGLIERIAWKKAGKTKGQAEAIGSRRAETKLANRMDEQTAEMLAKTNSRFQEKFRQPLIRREIYPQTLRFSTSNDALNVEAMHATISQLAASSSPPSLEAQDLLVSVHESLVANYGESVLGGMTLTDEKLEKLVQEATGNVPEELKVTAEKDPWSITFSPDLPVSANFGKQEVTIAIRAREFTRGEQKLRTPTKIAGTYTWEKTPTGTKMIRKGDVDVAFIGHQGSLSVSQVAFKTFIRRKFEAMMKPEIESSGIKLPGRWEHAGRLKMENVATDKGWIAIDWRIAPPIAPTAGKSPKLDSLATTTDSEN